LVTKSAEPRIVSTPDGSPSIAALRELKARLMEVTAVGVLTFVAAVPSLLRTSHEEVEFFPTIIYSIEFANTTSPTPIFPFCGMLKLITPPEIVILGVPVFRSEVLIPTL